MNDLIDFADPHLPKVAIVNAFNVWNRFFYVFQDLLKSCPQRVL